MHIKFCLNHLFYIKRTSGQRVWRVYGALELIIHSFLDWLNLHFTDLPGFEI